MKTGKHYFGMLTEEEQRNFKQACEEVGNDFDYALTRGYNNLYGFIRVNLTWGRTRQGYEYWNEIANSNRTEPPKENHLAQFKRMVLYLFIAFVTICILMAVHTVSYKQGKVDGFNDGADFGTREIQNLMNYNYSKAESIEQCEEMIKQQRK